VVAEIEALGGSATANTDDISSWEGAQRIVNQAVETFGGLDVVVNNAGILRDRVIVNMTEDDWAR
jgi:NAD(P)-dependent dehydrogenase (short-subunit alcohol dehydrogenase family)